MYVDRDRAAKEEGMIKLQKDLDIVIQRERVKRVRERMRQMRGIEKVIQIMLKVTSVVKSQRQIRWKINIVQKKW